MAINIARLGVVLGIDTAEFTKGINQAKVSLNNIGNFAMKAGAVATAALTAMTYKALQFSDQMADLSEATGVSVAKVLQMSNAMQRAGGEIGGGSKALVRFTQNIEEAVNGSQNMQDAFAKAGVSLQDLASLSVEELLNKTSQGIANIGDKATQTGLKMNLFGKSLLTVDMNTFNAYLNQSTDEFKQYEQAIKDAAQITDRLEQSANKVGLVFIEKFIPSLNILISNLSDKANPSMYVFSTTLEGIAWIVRNVSLGFTGLSAGIQTLSVSAQAFFGKISKEDAWKQMVNIENALNKSINQVRDFNKEVKKGEEIKAPQIPKTVKASPEAQKEAEMLRMATLISQEYSRQQIYLLQQQGVRNAMLGLTRDEARVQEVINQVTNATSQKIDEITRKREDAVGRGASEKVVAEYDRQIQKVKELEAVFIQTAKTSEETSIQAQRTFQYGWERAFNQFAEDAYNYATFAEQAFRAITGNMMSAIDNFVETGKLSFSDFATSIIKDLLKIEIKMQAMQLFSMTKGFFGGIFGGASGPEPLGNLGGAGFIGRATGGFIDGPAIVGENGPEIFIPQRSGTVIPNQQMGNIASKGDTYVTNNYIDAIDTKSFEDRLYSSSKAVWAANQYGNKNISTSRMRT
jgi:lambda family phage tail tape measure protein